jgi:glyoxylase-like metal-dependent hydrolase (beta-lactamase superfamily II)
MQKIADDILTWSWFSKPHGYGFNGFLILLSGANVCIDPAEPTDEDLEQIVKLGAARILVSNRNHARAANKIRARTGARTAIEAADAAYARAQGAELDTEIRVGEKVGPLTVIGVPGKSAGEVAFHWPERKILIVGDAVIGNPPGNCGLLRESVMDNPAQLRESVRALLKLDFDSLLMGDGQSIIGGAKQKLKDLVDTFPNQ